MSDPFDPPRRPNFAEAPAPRGRGVRATPGRSRPPAPAARRGPVSRPLLAAAAVGLATVVVLAVTIGVVMRLAGAPASADRVEAGPPAAEAAPPATAPPATPPRTAPLHTRPPAQENAARRAAFVETMKKAGLTEAQATCVANRVEISIGWEQLTESLMDPGKPGQLETLMVDCVKPKK